MTNLNDVNQNSEEHLEYIEVEESDDNVSIDSSSLKLHNWTEEEVSKIAISFLIYNI